MQADSSYITKQSPRTCAAEDKHASARCSLNPENLEDVLANILQLGDAVGMPTEARAAHAALLERIAAIDRLVVQRQRGVAPKVSLLEQTSLEQTSLEQTSLEQTSLGRLAARSMSAMCVVRRCVFPDSVHLRGFGPGGFH